MPVSIPESVFDKYFDVVDSTFDIFGVTCQLVMVESVEVDSSAASNVPVNNSINAHKKKQKQFNKGGKTVTQQEVLQDIKLKVYWDQKDFTKVSNNMVVPSNSIQTIFFATDLIDISKAKALIVHKGIKDVTEMRFVRAGEPFPMGLRQERYFGCFWERA